MGLSVVGITGTIYRGTERIQSRTDRECDTLQHLMAVWLGTPWLSPAKRDRVVPCLDLEDETG